MVNKSDSHDVTNILSFSTNTNFWVIRAEGGKYFNDFVENNYIGIRYNKVTVNDLIDLANHQSIITEETVKELYKIKYDPKHLKAMDRASKQKLTQHARQTYLFTFEMKSGDVVFVPGHRSEKFAVGFIVGDPYDESEDKIATRQKHAPENGIQYQISDYVKRRRVKWVSIIDRTELPSFLSWTITAHQAIMHVKFMEDGQKTRLMSMISPLYEYQNHIYLRIHTNKGGDFTTNDWLKLLSLSPSETKIVLKADINSPGFLTYVVNATDWLTLLNLLNHIWDSPAIKITDGVLVTGTIFIFGSGICKRGFIDWLQDRELKSIKIKSKRLDNDRKRLSNESLKLDNDAKRLRNKQLESTINTKPSVEENNKTTQEPVAEDLELSILQSGTAIQSKSNKSQRQKSEGEKHHTEGK